MPRARQRQRDRPGQVLRPVGEAGAAHAQLGGQPAVGVGEHVLAREQLFGQRQQPFVGEQSERPGGAAHAFEHTIRRDDFGETRPRRFVAARAQLAEQAVAAHGEWSAREFEHFVDRA